MLITPPSTKLKTTFLALSPIALIIHSLFSVAAVADDKIEVIEIHGDHHKNAQHLGSSEQLLTELGVDFSAAGGVSSLPILNGMMGDRVKVLVDGADLTAACANQMNPPLSYLSANQIKRVSVIAGISPVSAGGDNIAGVIHVSAIAPTFSDSSSLTWQAGTLGAQYRSVDEGLSLGTSAQWASKTVSLTYQGAYLDAKSYQDGHGDTVLDTLYRSQNHVLIAALKSDKQQLAVKLNHQHIPFQGFANQYMDMVDNTSTGLTTQWVRQTELGDFSAQINWQKVSHEMGFFSDEKTGKMPMKTDAEDTSYQLKFAHELNPMSTITIGQEFYLFEIEDWWPPVAGSMMMGPNDYHNIHDGKRQRLAAFAQLDQQLTANWSVSSGLRLENVHTNAGLVQNYNSMPMMMPAMAMPMRSIDAKAAEQFNLQDRKQSDTLLDATLLTRYALDNFNDLQFGLARKNRAPNLYERYSWGQSAMATSMIGWFGDGNGYIGDIHLAHETANTASITYSMMGDAKPWQLSANIWYSSVQDFIDAEVVGSFNRSKLTANKRNILQFTNVDAHLYGARIDGSVQLHDSKSTGLITLYTKVSATRGERDDSNDALYQIQPLHSEVKLIQQVGNWQHAISWQWVDSKQRVDERRFENQTESYHLINLQSSVTWQQLNITLAISNLFDTQYDLPLGGVNIAEFKANTTQGYSQLRGQGRSLSLMLNYQF